MSQLLNVVSSILSLSLLRTVCYVIEFYLLLYLWVLLVMRMLNFISFFELFTWQRECVCIFLDSGPTNNMPFMSN